MCESSAGFNCTLSFTSSGLGHYDKASCPVPIKGDLAGVKVQQVASYGDCSLAVSAEGQLFGWGNSEYLQLASVTEGTQVRGLIPELIVKVLLINNNYVFLSATSMCGLFILTDKLSKAATSGGRRQSAAGRMRWDTGGHTKW